MTQKRDDLADTSHEFTIFGLSRLVVAVISSVAWMAVSSGLILLNKELLSHGFAYPVRLPAGSTVVQCFGCLVWVLFGRKLGAGW